MAIPLIILCGQAGSGKNTAAGVLAEHGASPLAFADPIKRFAGQVLGFSEGALWGASEEREQLIPFHLNQARSSALSHVDAWFDSLGVVDAARAIGGPRYGVYWTWLENLQAFAARNSGQINARYALQTLGTEWGRRTVGEDLWVRHGIQTARAILNGQSYSRDLGLGARGAFPAWVVITDGRFPDEVFAVKERGGLAVLIEEQTLGGLRTPEASHESEMALAKIPRSWWDAVVQNDRRGGVDALRASIGEALRL